MLTYSEIQHPPIKGEIEFQDFCLKLARRYWNDGYAEIYGKRGDEQQGVDISGEDNVNGLKPVGMQCKGSESHKPRELSEKEIKDEVEKAKKFSVGSADLLAAQSISLDTFASLSEALTHPHVDPRSLLSVFQEFTLSLWSDPNMTLKRNRLVSGIFEGLLVHPAGPRLLRLFIANTHRRIEELPFPTNLLAPSWAEFVDRFLRGHFVYDLVATA